MSANRISVENMTILLHARCKSQEQRFDALRSKIPHDEALSDELSEVQITFDKIKRRLRRLESDKAEACKALSSRFVDMRKVDAAFTGQLQKASNMLRDLKTIKRTFDTLQSNWDQFLKDEITKCKRQKADAVERLRKLGASDSAPGSIKSEIDDSAPGFKRRFTDEEGDQFSSAAKRVKDDAPEGYCKVRAHVRKLPKKKERNCGEEQQWDGEISVKQEDKSDHMRHYPASGF